MNWVIALLLVLCACNAHAESTIYLNLEASRKADSAVGRLSSLESRLNAYIAARQQPQSGDRQERLEAIAGEAQMVLDLATDYRVLRNEVLAMTRSMEATMPARTYADTAYAGWSGGAEQLVRVNFQQGGEHAAEAAILHYLLVSLHTTQRNNRDLQMARTSLQRQLDILANNLGQYRRFLRGEISDLRSQTNSM